MHTLYREEELQLHHYLDVSHGSCLEGLITVVRLASQVEVHVATSETQKLCEKCVGCHLLNTCICGVLWPPQWP